MSDVFGINGWGIAALAVILGLAVLLAGAHLRKRRGRRDDRLQDAPEPRLAVLESTILDAQRRLVLVACDDVEHLILIGGPSDLVVENDVGRQRAVAQQRPVPHAQPAHQEPSAAPEPVLAGPQVAAGPKPAETGRAVKPAEPPAKPAEVPAKPAEAPAKPSPGRPALAAVPAPVAQPAGKSSFAPAPAIAVQAGPARPAAPKPADAGDPKAARAKQAADAPFGRRDLPGAPSAAPPAASQAGAKTAVLPPAEVPWPEGDSLESEIVKALRVEPKATAPSSAPPQQRAAAPAAKTTTPGTTLGDLADRLEEALAREVQNAGQKGGRLDLGLDAFGFDQANASQPAPETAKSAGAERRAKPEGVKAMPSAPEPETRREPRPPAEHKEEAPVISLSARRREPVDPLEDEMARLLGELTGDTGRR